MAARKISKKAQDKLNKDRVVAAYNATCNGIQVNVMDLSRISAVGDAAIAEGVDDIVLGQRIRAFVETIRGN